MNHSDDKQRGVIPVGDALRAAFQAQSGGFDDVLRETCQRLGVTKLPVVDPEAESRALRVRTAEQARNAILGKTERNREVLRDRCPAAYERFVDRDDMFPAEAWAKIQGWEGKTSFGLLGPTGSWKTTMVWRLIIDASVPASSLFVTTGVSLARAIQHQWRDDECKADVRRARECGLLFLDDWGKEARVGESQSAAVQEDVFNLIEKRLSEDRTLIYTTNLTGQEFQESMGDNFRAALWRRLRQWTRMVVCSPPKQNK